MLLAVALVFTSLPLMATAVSAEEAPAAMEKGDKIVIPNGSGANWTGVDFEREDYVIAKVRGGGYSFLPASLMYEYDSTTSAPTSESVCVAGQTYTYTVQLRTSANDTLGRKLQVTVSPTGNSGDKIGEKVFALTTEFAEYSGTFTIPAGSTGKYVLKMMPNPLGGSGDYGYWDMRGLKVTNSAGDIVYALGCYDESIEPEQWAFPASYTAYEHVHNKWLGADLTAATSATYDIADTKLLPGVYQLTGTFNTDADSIALSAKVNDTLMNVGATTTTEVTVDTNATTVYYTLNVEEETTLSTLGLAWTVNGTATKLKLSNLSFKCVELTGNAGNNASIKRGTVVATAESVAFWSADDAGASVEIDNSKNYVAMTVRGGGYSMGAISVYTPDDPDSPCKAGKMYTYTILMRENPNTEDHASRLSVNVSDNGNSSAGANPIHTNTFDTIPTEFTELTGSFTVPADCTLSKVFKIHAGFSGTYNGNAAEKRYTDWDFRGIKITDADGNDVVAYGVYNEKLAPSEWVMPKDNYGSQKAVGETELALIPDADGSAFAYDATGKDITLAPGTYVVTGNFAAASGSANVQLGVTAADGTTATGEEVTVGATKSPVTVEIEIENATKLSEISVTVDGKVYVGDIKIAEKPVKFTAPNVGIMMALLLKKPPKFEYTNLIPHVYNDAGTSYWSAPGNCTLTATIPEEGDAYLSMRGMEKNLDAFVYTPGVTLQPGTYKFSASIRSANKGVKTMVRALIGDKTFGNVWMDNSWLSIGGEFTVTETTEFIVRFFGGPDQSFKQPYDVTGLKLIYLNEDPNYVAPDPSEKEEEKEDVKPEVKKEYVDNGNEEVVLKAVDGSEIPNVFNDVGTDKWIIDDQSLTVKSQGGNLYLAMRDITVNHKGFTYKPGVTLEPGTYFFSADLRAAVKGDKTMLRAIINNETTVGNVWFTNDWTVMSGQFTVTAPTEFTVKFFGGPDGSFIQDYDVSNILVTNIG